MVAYRDCKGHLVCMADAQTGIVEIQHKDRAVRMTVPVGDSFTVTLRDTETVMTRISTRAFHVKIKPKSDYPLKTLYPRAFQTGQNHLIYYDFTTVE